MEFSRYALSPLREGDFTLYRGSCDGMTPILLVAAEESSLGCVERLKHEYALKAELDADWAARPVALTRYDDRMTLVLEDPGGAPVDRLLGRPLDVSRFLRIAIPLAGALRRVHERGLIHRDIKPANILADTASGGVWLTGFGIASRLPREHQVPAPPEVIAGTLAYMAPEQTGRMNRSVDSRSDLYALGVTFYEMLTGQLPFTAADPMEWVHCHIARQPMPPDERVGGVPGPLSAIVMKLLAKTGEERYQTAAGVEVDLQRCLADLESYGRIDEFPLGEHDKSDRLLIPERLYGRESEINTLLASFDRVVAGGNPELVLVSGYSGVGKSSVVNELHRPLVPPRGLFASGKFDQFKRDIPYATLAQAFQSLLRPLLSKSEAELSKWRGTLREALDPNGQLIVGLVPELELIIGEQPPVSELPPQDAQNRFQLVFRRFISVFTREHPLALFLDDLQWLDAATLDLMEDLLTRSDMQRLMLIGAYRDNEVNSTHPLMRKLEAIRFAGATVHDIVLAPLAREDLGQLVADSLHCKPERAEPLADLIYEKTAGNPFFVIQFIQALAEEALISFDRDKGQWYWDLHRIHAKGYTDNVVDLMVGRLNRLPIQTQKALQQLACLGNSADFAMLRMVSRDSNEEMHGQLWEAVRTGLIFQSEESYRFLHDRVHEAAYSLIPEGARPEAHLRIGRLLAASVPPEKREEAIFEIVSQLNRGVMLMTSAGEREQLAKFNLIAGKRAQSSTAYTSALNYLEMGAALLAEDCWQRCHDLIFSIELARAQCEFMSGVAEKAEKRLSMLADRATTTIEKSTVAGLRVDLYMTIDRSDRSVTVGLEALRNLGIDWSPSPTEEEVRYEYNGIWSQLAGRAIEDLADSPLMTDPISLITLDLLVRISVPAYFASSTLFAVAACRAVSLSLQNGNCDASCIAYVQFAMLAGPYFGNYDAGYHFGRLGCELVERPELKRFQTRTLEVFGWIMSWTRPVRGGRVLLARALDVANRTGDIDITYSGYGYCQIVTSFLLAGDPLVEAQQKAEDSLKFAESVRFGVAIAWTTGQLRLIRTLRGLTSKFGSFDEVGFDELEFERYLAANPALALPECWYWIRKAQARFLAGDYVGALEASAKAEPMLWASLCLLEMVEFHFYDALSHAAACNFSATDQRDTHLEKLAAHQKQLEIWAQSCPENFQTRAALVNAEIARIEGRELDAEQLYERAILSARESGFVHNEALSSELAARFYALRGFETISNAYLRKARNCYISWGAFGKVRQLEQLHPNLRDAPAAASPITTIGAPAEQLDVGTVLKAAQAVSGEIVLGELIKTLLRIAVEHAGAERGLLILFQDDEPQTAAEATTGRGQVEVTLHPTAAAPAELPVSVLHTVIRTRESVILDDALAQNPFSQDQYLCQKRARSVLCLPLVKQSKLIGVLYLENNLASHVFTPARISVLELLASQAAISLENARLYNDLREREARIRRLVDSNIIGVMIWDFQGRIIEANQAILDMLGYSREELIASRIGWAELTPAEWAPADQDALAQVRATGSCGSFEKEYFRKDGSRVPILIAAALFEWNRDEGVAFIIDMTDRKQAEERLRESERRFLDAQVELAHVTRITTLGELTASIAHEVSQPLAAVGANAEACLGWLRRGTPDIEAARRSVEWIIDDGKRANEVIRRVRALAKKTDIEKVLLDVNDVIRETIALVQRELISHRVLLQTELASALPMILVDRVQLQQVIINLVMNGIEAMQAVADRPRELAIRSGQDDAHQVHVTVTDCGVGISAENADRLFTPFFTTKSSGMGMGLSICRSIIEVHGGRLWAAAKVPHGAMFQFTLPVNADITSCRCARERSK